MSNAKKRLCTVALFAVFTVLCLCSVQFMSLFDVDQWLGVEIGGGIFALTLIAMIAWHKYFAACAAILAVNAVACGLTVSSIFVALGGYPFIWQTCIFGSCAVALFAAFALIGLTDFFHRHHILYSFLLLVVLVTLLTLGYFYIDKLIFTLALLYLIPFCGMAFVLATYPDNAAGLLKYAACASFCALILLIIVAIIILSEGDVLDSLDLDFGFGGSPKKPKKPKK